MKLIFTLPTTLLLAPPAALHAVEATAKTAGGEPLPTASGLGGNVWVAFEEAAGGL